MPKSPILDREVFYDKLNDGTFRELEFALVNTSLGAMIEPRPCAMISATGKITPVDVVDASFNRMTQMDEDAMQRLTGFSGRQTFLDFNY